jgi:lysophospholipase L1-like esterase
VTDTATSAPPRPRSLIKKGLLLLASTVFSLLLALALFEGYLRWKTPHVPTLEIYRDDFEIGKTLVPGFVGNHYGVPASINSRGMRDRELTPKKPAGMGLRAIALGDSWTFGVCTAVEKTWPKQLEGLLGGYPSCEVLNTGISGFETVNEAIYYKRDMGDIEHDLVIVGFYPCNDLHDKRKLYARHKGLHDIHPWLYELYIFPKRHLLVSHWYDEWRKARRQAKTAAFYDKKPVDAAKGHGFGPGDEDWTLDFDESGRDFRTAREHLAMIGTTARERHARPVLVLFPDNQDLARYTNTCNPKIAPLMARACKDAGIEFIDLVEDFRPWIGKEKDIAIDQASGATHVNALGYEIIAKAIARELKARGLLERKAP